MRDESYVGGLQLRYFSPDGKLPLLYLPKASLPLADVQPTLVDRTKKPVRRHRKKYQHS